MNNMTRETPPKRAFLHSRANEKASISSILLALCHILCYYVIGILYRVLPKTVGDQPLFFLRGQLLLPPNLHKGACL